MVDFCGLQDGCNSARQRDGLKMVITGLQGLCGHLLTFNPKIVGTDFLAQVRCGCSIPPGLTHKLYPIIGLFLR